LDDEGKPIKSFGNHDESEVPASIDKGTYAVAKFEKLREKK
jgi:hypothetical protein